MDRVSVIVPVYNAAPFLPRTLDAILDQSYENLEIIVVDDGSVDDSPSIIAKYADTDSRIHPIFFPENRGVSAARNRALGELTGDWVCFCDGDDWFTPRFVEKMLACAKGERADFVVCDYQVVRANRPGIPAGSTAALESGCPNSLAVAAGSLASCTHLVHRRLFALTGARYLVGCRQYEEMTVIPVLAACAARIGVCHEPLYCYFQRLDGSSASNEGDDSEENFRMAWRACGHALGKGWEKELQYHAIYALLYGEVLKACKTRRPDCELRKLIRRYRAELPDYEKNPYFPCLGLGKRLFLWFGKREWLLFLRLLAWVHGKFIG